MLQQRQQPQRLKPQYRYIDWFSTTILLICITNVPSALVSSFTVITSSSQKQTRSLTNYPHSTSTIFLASTVVATPPSKLKTTTTTASDTTSSIELSSVVTRVAVAGATGKTGQYVVQELLKRGVSEVVAIVRNSTKGVTVFTDNNNKKTIPKNLKIITCDYTDEQQVRTAMKGCDAVIWCATGFVIEPTTPLTPFVETFQKLFNVPVPSPRSIDTIGLPIFAQVLLENQQRIAKIKSKQTSTTNNNNNNSIPKLPKLIVCSSAGVTRPTWSDEKKKQYPGAADIPIVRLNPMNILQRKLDSENAVRSLCINDDLLSYTIVRPCGLNDNWPSNSRPIFTQGDVAVGRCSRYDVACVLVDLLTSPAGVQKTFEMVSIAGYPPAISINTAIERLQKDTLDVSTSTSYDSNYIESTIEVSYQIMQQLLPGEKQNSAALAMGQTYEQLDTNTVGRLGVRGQEDISTIGPV